MGHNDLAAGIWPVSCATVGSLLGFLVFNVYPARVFMGDTGSLALGGICGSNSIDASPVFIYPNCCIDLYDRGIICYGTGIIF